MTVTLSYYLEDVNAQIAADWTDLRLYRDTDPAGAFATLVESEALVADEQNYEFEDTTGTARHWYRVALYDSVGLSLSTKGDPFRPDATRLLDVMVAAAEICGAGFASECSSTGTVNSLVDDTLLDNGLAADYLQAGYIYLPAAAAADKVRRVAAGGFDFTTGSLRPIRAWSAAPEADDEYCMFLLLPPFKAPGAPYGWAEAARDGLQECYFEDMVDVGTGTSDRETRFDLGPYLGLIREGDIRSVRRRTYNESTGVVQSDAHAGKNGRFYRTEPNGRGQLTLVVKPAPTTREHVIVEANRRDAEIYAYDDVTSCPLRLAARAAAWKAYEYLDRVHMGKYQGEVNRAHADWMAEYQGERPTASVNT